MTGLSFKQQITVNKVGAHPDNREGAGLIVGDTHNMATILARDGWNSALQINALVGQMPPSGAVRERWQKFNVAMWKSSAGHLARSPENELDYCTARGSHSTGALRLLLHGGVSTKTELTFECEGKEESIKVSRILERQPSLRDALDTGLEYDRLRVTCYICLVCHYTFHVLYICGLFIISMYCQKHSMHFTRSCCTSFYFVFSFAHRVICLYVCLFVCLIACLFSCWFRLLSYYIDFGCTCLFIVFRLYGTLWSGTKLLRRSQIS